MACASFGSSAESGPAPEAGVEAAPPGDVPPPAEAGSDGGDASFCATEGADASFCADFDEAALTTGWTRTVVVEADAPSPDTTNFVSPPRSLRCVALDVGGALDAGSLLASTLGRDLPDDTNASEIDFSFSVRVERVVDSFVVGGFLFQTSSFIVAVSILFDDRGNLTVVWTAAPNDGGPGEAVDYPLLAATGEIGNWHRIALHLSLGAGDAGSRPAVATLTVDGSASQAVPIRPVPAGVTPAIALGVGTNAPAGASASFDNVVVRR